MHSTNTSFGAEYSLGISTTPMSPPPPEVYSQTRGSTCVADRSPERGRLALSTAAATLGNVTAARPPLLRLLLQLMILLLPAATRLRWAVPVLPSVVQREAASPPPLLLSPTLLTPARHFLALSRVAGHCLKGSRTDGANKLNTWHPKRMPCIESIYSR